MEKKFVNLTVHAINIYNEYNEEIMVLPPSGAVARVAMSKECVGEIGGVPIFVNTYGEIEGLPDANDEFRYVVSGMVEAALEGERMDVFSPGDLKRDEAGKPCGCIGLKQSH